MWNNLRVVSHHVAPRSKQRVRVEKDHTKNLKISKMVSQLRNGRVYPVSLTHRQGDEERSEEEDDVSAIDPYLTDIGEHPPGPR